MPAEARTVQAIQTRYAGYNFRSRLEARWAVAFDAMRLCWEYEPEGFKLPNGEMYLPDFRLTFPHSRPLWVEVKPEGGAAGKFMKFLDALPATHEGDRGAIFRDIPDPRERDWTTDVYFASRNGGDCDYTFWYCPQHRSVGFEYAYEGGRCCKWYCHGETDHPLILNAFAAARGARFEHDAREVWA